MIQPLPSVYAGKKKTLAKVSEPPPKCSVLFSYCLKQLRVFSPWAIVRVGLAEDVCSQILLTSCSPTCVIESVRDEEEMVGTTGARRGGCGFFFPGWMGSLVLKARGLLGRRALLSVRRLFSN